MITLSTTNKTSKGYAIKVLEMENGIIRVTLFQIISCLDLPALSLAESCHFRTPGPIAHQNIDRFAIPGQKVMLSFLGGLLGADTRSQLCHLLAVWPWARHAFLWALVS